MDKPEEQRISEEFKQLNIIVGKIANRLTSLSIYEKMEKDVSSNSYCDQHIGFVETLAVIRQTVIDIKEKVDETNNFRRKVTTTLAMIVFTIILQVVSFAYLVGRFTKQVEINTDIITQPYQPAK